MGLLLRHCCFVSFTLFLLYATTLTPTYGDEEEEDGGGGGGGGGGDDQGKKAEKVIDEWETEEPHYDEPEWMMPEGAQTLEFGGQDLNDADKWSPHMPLELKCDGCRAIAYAIKLKLKAYQKRYRTRHVLSEADVVELLDEVCDNKNKEFDGYGLKEILGRRRLSGPGLETKDTPGVSHGGGQWPYRLQQMCKEYVEEVGEYRIYKRFLQRRSLENFLCRNRKSELGWICPKKRKRRKKTEGEGEGEATPSETPTGENELPQDSDQPAKESESSTGDSGPPKQAGEDAQQQPSEGSKSSEEGAGKPQAGDAEKSVQPPQEAKTPEEGAPKPKDGVKSPAEEAAKPPEPSQDAEKPKEDPQNSPKEGVKSTHKEAEADQKTRKENASEDSKNRQDGKGKDEKGKGDQAKPKEKQQQSSAEDAKAKSETPKGDKKTPKEEL